LNGGRARADSANPYSLSESSVADGSVMSAQRMFVCGSGVGSDESGVDGVPVIATLAVARGSARGFNLAK